MTHMRHRWVVACHPARPTTHRYLLHVRLAGYDALPGRTLAIIQKNPSLADAERSDPTAGRVEAWARRAGFTDILFTNLFAWRSPYPAALNGVPPADAVGSENDAAILAACAHADIITAAWGNPNGIAPALYTARVATVVNMLHALGVQLHRVGWITQSGYPLHGLRWKAADELHRWP